MKRWMYFILFIFLLAMGALIGTKQTSLFQEHEVRGAIDIGSGTTNLKVAKIDPKTNKIISILYEKTVPVGYQKQLEQSTNHRFDDQVMQEGIASIKQLKELAADHHASKVVAIATAAFREAANGKEFAQEIKKQTGVQVRVIDQDEEGILAFRGAIALTTVQPEQAVVWDIGGGSMQFTTLSPEGTYLIEHGKLASIPFRNAIIEQIENKELTQDSSPNPMNESQMQAALEYASKKAEQTAPFFKEKLLQPTTQVLAVGNLFNLGIKPLVEKDPIMTSGNKKSGKTVMHESQLIEALTHLKDRSDAQLSEFSMPEIAVSNPLLVAGYMQGLHIHHVEFVRVNNADGALTYPAYWTN